MLLISSDLSSTVPSSFRHHPLTGLIELPSASPPDPMHHHSQLAQTLDSLISSKSRTLPVCVVVDVMMSWSNEVFMRYDIPIIGFFTSGACSAAMEYAMWKAHPLDLQPGKVHLLPGLPEEMSVTYSDLQTRPHMPPGGPPPHFGGGPSHPPPPGGVGPPKMGPPKAGDGGGPRHPPPPGGVEPKMGPPKAGDQPPWLAETSSSVALFINTCAELEGPFLDYLSKQIQKPVWGIGPLLPDKYWESAGSLLYDRQIRTSRSSNVSEEDVVRFLDSKPPGSVLYVSFGSEVGPDMEEYPELAKALEASNRPFIWVIQPGSGRHGPPPQFLSNESGSEGGYYPQGLDKRVGERGLIIQGWAPQLLILSHPATGGFLSHCGWNSSVEAMGRGVPFLAWPIRGDQQYNAKLIVKYLRIGYMVSEDLSGAIGEDDVMKGVEKLMGDEEVRKRAKLFGAKFHHGFPPSSVAAFREFIKKKDVLCNTQKEEDGI